jgi:Na+-driven multidrug efflux pump
MGDAELGAHQIAFQLYTFLALILDAIAIAGQVLVGRMLGAGDADEAHAAAARMIAWSVAIGALFGAGLLALEYPLTHVFTGDEAVIDAAGKIWPLFALMQPLAGAVFALDGILIGAGDTSYLMWSMLAASFVVFIPIALASLAFGWGIVGVWLGLDALIAARLAFLGVRFMGRRWAVVGWA